MAVNYGKYFRMAEERGITSNQIMQEANISANILTRMRRNEYISLESIDKICGALGCKVDDILELEHGNAEEE